MSFFSNRAVFEPFYFCFLLLPPLNSRLTIAPLYPSLYLPIPIPSTNPSYPIERPMKIEIVVDPRVPAQSLASRVSPAAGATNGTQAPRLVGSS